MPAVFGGRLMVVASSATRRPSADEAGGGGDIYKNIMWYTYIIQSITNKRLYVGVSNNLKRRFREHNQGIGGKYTRDNRPFKLIFYEAYLEKKDAYRAEKFFKSGYGREILKQDKLKSYFEKTNHSGIV